MRWRSDVMQASMAPLVSASHEPTRVMSIRSFLRVLR